MSCLINILKIISRSLQTIHHQIFQAQKNTPYLPFIPQKVTLSIHPARCTGEHTQTREFIRAPAPSRDLSFLCKPFQPGKTSPVLSNAVPVISGRGGAGKASRPPAQGPVHGLMEQDDLEACKSELSISTASQNTPTATRPKAHAPATERTVITIFCRSAFSLHWRTSVCNAPQTEPRRPLHPSCWEG